MDCKAFVTMVVLRTGAGPKKCSRFCESQNSPEYICTVLPRIVLVMRSKSLPA